MVGLEKRKGGWREKGGIRAGVLGSAKAIRKELEKSQMIHKENVLVAHKAQKSRHHFIDKTFWMLRNWMHEVAWRIHRRPLVAIA